VSAGVRALRYGKGFTKLAEGTGDICWQAAEHWIRGGGRSATYHLIDAATRSETLAHKRRESCILYIDVSTSAAPYCGKRTHTQPPIPILA
jgi:hypothetical protein